MSLPPGFLDELRTRLSLAQVAGRKVMWDMRKSNQAKGDWWAPCPFHQEKTASFHVDDKKGFYYCFGCHAKGDMISFVRETENVDFMEAVRILAREAGLTMPERDPQAQQKADRRTRLGEVMEQAVRHYRMLLRSGAGAAARDYLEGRGLGPEALDRWEIGFAPDAWQGLWDHLRGQGIDEGLILGAGLAKPSTKGGKPYDTFRGRIMFPIRDARGRCIAFGGRAMDPSDNAKYLNSPETELFDKGRSLFNHGPAREAAGKGQPLIVAEGYMDVIALAEAGFAGAVAPLGTAITEHQLAMLWRIAPEPVIALDGDTAGLRAAYRAMDLAMPLLEAGQSLRFALMPEGMDPDDLLRAKGPGAVAEVVAAAQPMVSLLWRRETEGRVLDSPERKAALDKSLREAIGRIKDPSIRAHYGQTIKDLRWQLFRSGGARGPGASGRRGAPKRGEGGAQPDTRQSALARGLADQDALREAQILAVLVRNERILPDFIHALEEMEFTDPDHDAIRRALLADPGDSGLEARLAEALGPEALDALLTRPHVAVMPVVRHPNTETAGMVVRDELERLNARRGHAREMVETLEEFSQHGDEQMMRRLGLSLRAVHQAERAEAESRVEYEFGPNGAPIRRDEKDALEKLLSGLTYAKPSRRD
ncbi:MAG: DNA primase [Rhodobacterales bacterium]|nr:MAG: DNA primase [Rhodobacterales bacterium]